MKPEIIYDMPEQQYHDETGLGEGKFVTRSMIVAYHQDPSSFKLKYIDKEPLMQFTENEGTKFGVYVERYLLDKDVSMYVEKPVDCINAKGDVAPWNKRQSQYVMDANGNKTGITTIAWEAANEYIIDQEQAQLAVFLEKRFSDTALGQFWINGIDESKKQVAIRWTDEESGLNVQIRIDNWIQGSYACDLKSTGKRLEKFSDAAHDFGYHFQQAMYQDGIEIATGNRDKFLFAVGETTGLRRAAIRQLHSDQVNYAIRSYKKALVGIAAGDFMAVGFDKTEAEMCEIPAYLHYEYNEEQ